MKRGVECTSVDAQEVLLLEDGGGGGGMLEQGMGAEEVCS